MDAAKANAVRRAGRDGRGRDDVPNVHRQVQVGVSSFAEGRQSSKLSERP
jgi:hypothetical protein